jgi:hypothetical protein
LRDASNEVITIKPYNDLAIYKSPNYEDKLVYFHGELKIREPLGDQQYNILVQAVKLKKIVDVYQWHEDYTESAFATEDSSNRNYFYYKEWSERVVDSRSFHSSLAHQNPLKKPMETKINIADKAYIGNFEIGEEGKEKFNTWVDVTSDTKPDDSFIKMHSGAYYHTENLFEPEVGDLRIRFQFAGLEGDFYSVVGHFKKGVIVPAQKNRRKILLLSKGRVSIEDLFHQEHLSNSKEVWFTRLFGFLLILFSIVSTENMNRAACE